MAHSSASEWYIHTDRIDLSLNCLQLKQGIYPTPHKITKYASEDVTTMLDIKLATGIWSNLSLVLLKAQSIGMVNIFSWVQWHLRGYFQWKETGMKFIMQYIPKDFHQALSQRNNIHSHTHKKKCSNFKRQCGNNTWSPRSIITWQFNLSPQHDIYFDMSSNRKQKCQIGKQMYLLVWSQ